MRLFGPKLEPSFTKKHEKDDTGKRFSPESLRTFSESYVRAVDKMNFVEIGAYVTFAPDHFVLLAVQGGPITKRLYEITLLDNHVAADSISHANRQIGMIYNNPQAQTRRMAVRSSGPSRADGEEGVVNNST